MYIFSDPKLIDMALSKLGGIITCTCYDETLIFYKITEQEFYDSVIAFQKINITFVES